MPSANDYIVDKNTQYSIQLNRLAGKTTKEVVQILQNMEQELIARLANTNLTDFQQARTQQLLNFIENTLQQYYGKVADSVRLTDLAELETKFWSKTINTAVDFKIIDSLPTKSQLASLVEKTVIKGDVWKNWWDGQAKSLQTKFTEVLKQSLASGEDTYKIIQRVRGTREFGFKDGIMQAARRDAEALVRTGMQTVSNETRNKFFQDNADIMKGFMQLSTLDSRTTEICAAYSGKMWDMNKKPIGHTLPYNGGTPRHWNCRSTIIPVTKSWQELGLKGKDLKASTRSSMDGQIPADISFDKWLKSKPQKFVEDMLGKGKAQLFLDKKITVSELVASDGKTVLTLDELLKIYDK